MTDSDFEATFSISQKYPFQPIQSISLDASGVSSGSLFTKAVIRIANPHHTKASPQQLCPCNMSAIAPVFSRQLLPLRFCSYSSILRQYLLSILRIIRKNTMNQKLMGTSLRNDCHKPPYGSKRSARFARSSFGLSHTPLRSVTISSNNPT